jgi:hypothetical protein
VDKYSYGLRCPLQETWKLFVVTQSESGYTSRMWTLICRTLHFEYRWFSRLASVPYVTGVNKVDASESETCYKSRLVVSGFVSSLSLITKAFVSVAAGLEMDS